jgi:hypothetical protein
MSSLFALMLVDIEFPALIKLLLLYALLKPEFFIT